MDNLENLQMIRDPGSRPPFWSNFVRSPDAQSAMPAKNTEDVVGAVWCCLFSGRLILAVPGSSPHVSLSTADCCGLGRGFGLL